MQQVKSLEEHLSVDGLQLIQFFTEFGSRSSKFGMLYETHLKTRVPSNSWLFLRVINDNLLFTDRTGPFCEPVAARTGVSNNVSTMSISAL